MSLDKFGRAAAASHSSSTASHSLSPYRHGFIFTGDGNIDVENLKLCNVKGPTEEFDCANKQYVDNLKTNLLKKLNVIPDIVNQQIDLNMKAYKIKYDSDVTTLRDIISTNKSKCESEIKSLRTNLENKIDQYVINLKNDISLFTRNFILEEIKSQSEKINKDIKRIEHKTAIAEKTALTRIGTLERSLLSNSNETLERSLLPK